MAGLATARAASQRGASFVLLEASPRLGGNAMTLRHGDFRFDSGAHRLHDKDALVTRDLRRLLGARLRPVSSPSRVYTGGEFVNFPFTVSDVASKLGAGTLIRVATDCVRMQLRRRDPPRTFAELAVMTYGKTLAERFLLNYSEKLWGIPCDRLSTAVAGARLKGLDPLSLLRRVFGSQIEHLDGSFLYPKGGIGEIAEALAEGLAPGSLRTGSRVTRLLHDGRRLTAVEAGGRTYTAKHVISTLPITATVGLLDPRPTPEVLELARGIRYRHLLLPVFFLDRDGVSDYASTYFPEARFPFTRVHEPRCRSAEMAPPGKTSLVVEIPTGAGDALWSAPDEDVLDLARGHLRELGWIRNGEELGATVHRMPNAYPVLDVDALHAVRRLRDMLDSFRNLSCVGRAATFSYVHIHDLVRSGLDAIERLEDRPRTAGALG